MMVWHHLSTALLVLGVITLLVGGVFSVIKLVCLKIAVVKECSTVGLKYLLVLPGIVLAAVGWFLHQHKEKTLSDAESLLRYGEIDSHCPNCYTQGVVKSSGLFSHKMTCPKCRREWRILDL